MKDIYNYIKEGLSNDRLKQLTDIINDDNFDFVFPKIQQAVKSSKTIGQQFKDFFTNKGLANSFFSNKPELGHRISDIFAKYDNIEVLDKLINENGIIGFEDIVQADSVNINDTCKDFGFEDDVISEIANINDVLSNNANVGKYELLLKMILKENAAKSDKGDICITLDGSNIDIEVKAGKSLAESARVCGQIVKSIPEMSNYFARLYHKETDTILFGGAGMGDKLSNFLNHKIDVNLFIKNLCAAILYQYILPDSLLDDLTLAVKNYNENNEVITTSSIKPKEFIQLFGILQAYGYMMKDKWDYICVINTKNGDCAIHGAIDKITAGWIESIHNKFEFYYPEGNENAIGRRGISRIFVRK